MDNELTVTVADLIEHLKEFPPNAVVKVKDDIGEFDPVVVWVPINLAQVGYVNDEVRIG